MGNKKEAFDKGLGGYLKNRGQTNGPPQAVIMVVLRIHAPGSQKSKNRILNQMTAKLECDEKTSEAEFGLSVAFLFLACYEQG